MKKLVRNFFLITLLILGIETVSSITSITRSLEEVAGPKDYTQAVTKEILDNGMTVLMYRNPSVPKVLVQVAYSIGSYVEDAGERGLAHILEHMIFKGTDKLSETDIDSIACKYGASFNAFTSNDITSYYFETNKNNWKPFVGILADCMQNARFDDQHLSSELWAVIQELKMYKDDYWRMMLGKMMSSIFPANHPYHAPIIGYKEDLLDMTGKRIRNFYDKYYHPDHAILVVAGDIDPVDVMTTVKQQFGNIPKNNTPLKITFPERSSDLVSMQTRCYEDVKNDHAVFYWRIPGLKDQQDVLSTAVAFLLGSGENSPLHKALVDEHQVAASVGVAPYKFMEDGLFCIFLEPLSGKADVCKQIIQNTLLKSMEQGFSAHEFDHMIHSQKKAFFSKLENLQGLAYEWITSYFATKDEFSVFSKVKRFEAVTSLDVQNFMKMYLDPFIMNDMAVLPMPENKKDQMMKAKQLSDEMDKKILSSRPRTAPIEEQKFAKVIGNPEPLSFSFPKPHRVLELDNGLTVMLYANKSLPIMSLSCRFKNANYHTKIKENAVLDIMMGMLIEGSSGYTKEENVTFFDSFGADFSFTDSGAELSLLSDDYAVIFKRFLHTLMHPTFPVDALEKTREIVLDGLERSKDDQQTVGFRELSNLLYKGHPYAWTFDESIALTQTVTVDDLKRFHQKFVNPKNVVMSIVGDFDLDEMQQVVTDIFEPWPTGDVVLIVHAPLNYEAKKIVDVPMLRDQVVLLLGRPSKLDVYHEDLVPVRLLNYIAFKSLGSRIFQLRQQSGLFYTASGSWAEGASRDPGVDYLFTLLTPDKVDEVDQQFRILVDRIGTDGVTSDELAAAQQMYFKTLIDTVTSNRAKATLLCTLKDLDLPFDRYDIMLKRVRSMTLDEINKVAKKYFNTENMTSIRVGRV